MPTEPHGQTGLGGSEPPRFTITSQLPIMLHHHDEGVPARLTTRRASGRGSWLRRGPRLQAAGRGPGRRRPAPRGRVRRQPLRCACAATRPRAARAGPPPRRVPGGALDAANPRRPSELTRYFRRSSWRRRGRPRRGAGPRVGSYLVCSGRGSRGDAEVGSPGRRPTWAVGPRPPPPRPPRDQLIIIVCGAEVRRQPLRDALVLARR